MIVKNEETTLPKCLGSVKNFVDETTLTHGISSFYNKLRF
jgi:hypothetical protein